MKADRVIMKDTEFVVRDSSKETGITKEEVLALEAT